MLLLSLLFAVGLALISQQALRYSSQSAASRSAQARALAWAGLERIRVRLTKDIRFPPACASDQNQYSFSEEVFDVDGVTSRGHYQAHLDLRYQERPYQVLPVRCDGITGPLSHPTCRFRVLVELDLASTTRGGITPNPHILRPFRVQESEL